MVRGAGADRDILTPAARLAGRFDAESDDRPVPVSAPSVSSFRVTAAGTPFIDHAGRCRRGRILTNRDLHAIVQGRAGDGGFTGEPTVAYL